MSHNNTNIYDFVENKLEFALGYGYDDINVRGIAEDLAEDLKINGYCSDPYFEYDKALMCPINKNREKYCNNKLCTSHIFCELLRKEGYV